MDILIAYDVSYNRNGFTAALIQIGFINIYRLGSNDFELPESTLIIKTKNTVEEAIMAFNDIVLNQKAANPDFKVNKFVAVEYGDIVANSKVLSEP